LQRIYYSYIKNTTVFILRNFRNILVKSVSYYLKQFERYGVLKKYYFLGHPAFALVVNICSSFKVKFTKLIDVWHE